MGDNTSSTSRRLNSRTVSKSLAFTDHFDLSFLGTGLAFLPFRDFCDFCLVAFEIEADLVGDFRGDKAGLDRLLLENVDFRGLGLRALGRAGAGLVGCAVMRL